MINTILNIFCGVVCISTWSHNLFTAFNGKEISKLSIILGFTMGVLFGIDRLIRGLISIKNTEH